MLEAKPKEISEIQRVNYEQVMNMTFTLKYVNLYYEFTQ
jgi:hypothetical protein